MVAQGEKVKIESVSFTDMLDLSSYYIYIYIYSIMNYYYIMKDLIHANASILNNYLIKLFKIGIVF